MALSVSTDKIGEDGRELLSYGSPDYPIAFIDDDLTEVMVPWHWHDEYELVYICEGRERVQVAGRAFEVEAGQGYFVSHAILHSAELLTERGRQWAMVFGDRLIGSPMDIYWKKYIQPVRDNPNLDFEIFSPECAWQKEVLDRMKEVFEAGAYDVEDDCLLVREGMSRIFSLITKHMPDATPQENREKLERQEERLKIMLSFMEGNLSENIYVGDIASSAGVSVSECLRCFRDVMDATPIHFLRSLRLERASELLAQGSGSSVTEVAGQVGFTDMSYFTREFRKQFGKTPREYRKEIRN